VGALPICGDDHRLVGIVSQADIARHLPDYAIAQFVKSIWAPQAIAAAEATRASDGAKVVAGKVQRP
jgi:hypothetical protein